MEQNCSIIVMLTQLDENDKVTREVWRSRSIELGTLTRAQATENMEKMLEPRASSCWRRASAYYGRRTRVLVWSYPVLTIGLIRVCFDHVSKCSMRQGSSWPYALLVGFGRKGWAPANSRACACSRFARPTDSPIVLVTGNVLRVLADGSFGSSRTLHRRPRHGAGVCDVYYPRIQSQRRSGNELADNHRFFLFD